MNKIEYMSHEIKHAKELEEIASECTLFLKREDDSFPYKDFTKVALFGNGARKTMRGGTGSGNVNVHHFVRIEEAFENEGIEVVSKKWLDDYDEFQASRKPAFIERNKKEAKENNTCRGIFYWSCPRRRGIRL